MIARRKNSRSTRGRQNGMYRAGEIMPIVLERLLQQAEAAATEDSGEEPSDTRQHVPRFTDQAVGATQLQLW